MVKNIREIKVSEGFEATREGQVGPKMGPSWDKMGSGSELDGIFGHLRSKMAVKYFKLLRRMAPRGAKEAPRRPEGGQDGPKMAAKRGQDGPKNGAKMAARS